MRRLATVFGTAVIFASILTLAGSPVGRFDQKLPIDKQIVHVLNRLTFGPRPGDAEQVRRLGVDKWIDLQMHPERNAENPVLAAKLQPLETMALALWQIQEKFSPLPPVIAMMRQQPLFSIVPPQLFTKLNNCSVEERQSILASLEPENRRQILSRASPQMLEGMPAEVREEAAKFRREDQEAQQQAFRRMNPPLNELLTPEQIVVTGSGTPEQKIALLNSLDDEKRRQVLRVLRPQSLADVPQLRREALTARQPQEAVNSELIENKLYRAVYSNHQLEEVLTDFWVNHFNVFNGKGPVRVYLTSYERDAIRPHLFGHFKDMLLATARHPAMLYYLDNFQSQVPRDDSPFPLPPPPDGARRPGLNENYGRELMELHTMGVDGGYTQEDVIAVARAFTGWTIYDQQKYAEFQFQPAMHDRKEKIVLGHTIPAGGGETDGLQVIDILVHHPSTAKFISKKMAQRFVADDPPQSLVNRMADTFTRTDGDLRAVMQSMFSSVEFMSEGAWQAKLKSPLEMVISAARALNAEVDDAVPLGQRIGEIGQPLYGKVEPTGYPNTAESWTNSAGILGRINFATALTGGKVAGIKIDVSKYNFKSPAAVAGELFGFAPTTAMVTSIEKGTEGKEVTPSLLLTVVLGSPEFQRR